jgi:hypothetical protein
MLRVDGGLSVESGGATVLVTNNGDIGTTTNDSLQFYTNNGNYQLVLSPSLYAELTRIGAAPASVTRANAYLHVGGNEFSANSFRAITFGYQPTGNTNVPAYVGYQETSVAGETEGDLLLATRAVTTDTAPTIRMRVDSEGTVILPSTSPTPAVSNTSANSCGTTAATIAGNNNTGVITVGATGGTDCTLTFTTTAPVGWNCSANNNTTGVPLGTIPTSTTVVRVVGVFAAADVLGYICFPR